VGEDVAFRLAEILGEGDLLGIAQHLDAKHQYRVGVDGLPQRRHCPRRHRPGRIDPADLGHETRSDGLA
jgi:hypothetical protein